MHLFPEKYEELDISKYDKQLLAFARKAYRDSELATFMLSCNPTKTTNGKVDVLIIEQGIVCIKIMPDVNQATLLPALFERQVQHVQEKSIIVERMKLNRNLIENGKVKYSVSVITIFPSCERPTLIDNPAMIEFNSFVKTQCAFSDFFSKIIKSEDFFGEIAEEKGKKTITEDVLPDIVNRLTPEYTIPQKKAAVDFKIKTSLKELIDMDVSEKDRAALAYLLDESQINYINKIKKGDQLIIACAGSGKSVILLSKCFKVASLNPEKKFLVTGYNRNLVSYFKWLIDSAGFSSNNVECLTFHKLAITLLNRNGLQVPSTSQNDYTRVVKKLEDELMAGRIKDRYYGIFIDEVQMFEPEWYRICYQLLENHKAEEHFFVICGDKSQSVKKWIKSGKAPWQGHGEQYPSFRGKSFPIEINYRNSIQINSFVRRFTDMALRYAEICHIQMNQDSDIFLRGKAIREGEPVKIINVKQKSSEAEAKAVLNQIIDIHENFGVPFDSIAVVYYNKQYKGMRGWGEKDYEPIYRLRELLKEENIPDCILVNSGDEYGVSYADISGVPIVSMESSLGLDFRAVILCGIRPLGYYDKTKELKLLISNKEQPNIYMEEAYCRNINIVYMACARAKDILRVVLTENENESIYARMLIRTSEDDLS